VVVVVVLVLLGRLHPLPALLVQVVMVQRLLSLELPLLMLVAVVAVVIHGHQIQPEELEVQVVVLMVVDHQALQVAQHRKIPAVVAVAAVVRLFLWHQQQVAQAALALSSSNTRSLLRLRLT
jgi:hypothetical protein